MLASSHQFRTVVQNRFRLPVWKLMLIFLLDLRSINCDYRYHASVTAVLARINVSYVIPGNDSKTGYFYGEFARFATGAVGSAVGELVSGDVGSSAHEKIRNRQGCSLDVIKPPVSKPWVALFLIGGCTDAKKVNNAYKLNASAVLLYGHDLDRLSQDETFKEDAVVAILLARQGDLLAQMIDQGYKINLQIVKGQVVKLRVPYNFKRTSVLFVSISFVVLMFLSLAWLAVYYIQRLRDINSKGRMAKSLNRAVKKALSKMPTKVLKNGDQELGDIDCCPICIESYRISESTRTLPCKHHFHKKCVDPWLLENRTCPMCKMDILNYYGYSININEDSASNEDRNGQVTTSGLPVANRNNPSNSQPHAVPQIAVISQSELPLSSMLAAQSATINTNPTAPDLALLTPRPLTGSRIESNLNGNSSVMSLCSSETSEVSDKMREIGHPEKEDVQIDKNDKMDKDNSEKSQESKVFCKVISEENDAANLSVNAEIDEPDAKIEPEGFLPETTSPNETTPSKSPSQSLSPDSSKNEKSKEIVTIVPYRDIEHLIKEIEELEHDEFVDGSPPLGVGQTYNKIDTARVCIEKSSTNVSYIVPDNHSQNSLQILPTVDCQLNPVSGLAPINEPNFKADATSADGSRPSTAQQNDAGTNDEPTRKLSSHIITISHS